MTGGTVTASNGNTADIMANIANIGTEPLILDSIRIVPENPQSNGSFTFRSSADSLTAYLLAYGATKDVMITYTARRDSITYPPLTITIHKVWLIAYYKNNGKVCADSCEVIGNTIYLYAETLLKLPEKPISKDEKFTAILNIDKTNINDISYRVPISGFDIKINFNSTLLKVNMPDIRVGNLLQGKYQLQNVAIQDFPGVLTLQLISSFPNIINFSEGEILNVTFNTTINQDFDSISVPIEVNMNDQFDGIDINGCTAYITLWNTSFTLVTLAPNPVTNNKAILNFKINKDGFSKILIYNEIGKIVLSPIQEYLKAGIYSVDLNLSNLPNGVYWYQITSGLFSKLEKMVIIR